MKFWVGEQGAFDMLFEFSHVNVMFPTGEVWHSWKPFKLTALKNALSESQKATAKNGWYPIYFENHDKPRCINNFFAESVDPIKAAKAIATILLTLRGTPFIYQGQELGCTNVKWKSIDQYNDISSIDQFNWAIKDGFSKEDAMKFVHKFSRDNARTPMQWNNSKNAGFSNGTPWLPINENYIKVNAAAEEKDPNSVLNWYKKLAKFRSKHQELIAGDYELLLPNSEEIFAFARNLNNKRMITVVNFSLNTVDLPKEFISKKILVDSEDKIDLNKLKPLEARIYG